MLEQYQLPMPKPEGVAVDIAAHRIYIVSDYTNSLYVLQYPGTSP
jgi:hypothetical protein